MLTTSALGRGPENLSRDAFERQARNYVSVQCPKKAFANRLLFYPATSGWPLLRRDVTRVRASWDWLIDAFERESAALAGRYALPPLRTVARKIPHRTTAKPIK